MLPAKILTDYSDKFLGFGNWEAKIWFIGIEEAGGWKEQDVQSRLAAWKQNRNPELADASSFYPASGKLDWHGDDAKPQATWKQLIRLLLVARGQSDNAPAILDYQRTRFGRTAGRECLLELLPLPSPSSTDWNYNNWSDLPWLQTRARYQSHFVLQRANAIRERIEQHRPKVVVFYSAVWHRTWSLIAGGEWAQTIKGKLMGFDCDGISFYVSRHPRAESDNYFRQIGNFLQEKHGGKS